MGSPCALHLYGDAETVTGAADAGCAEVERLEHKYSRYREGSLASRINRSAGQFGGVEVDPETAGLLDYADVAHRESGGLFDISSGILRRVWNYKSDRIPSQAEIEPILACIGWDKVDWNGRRITLPLPEMELDFGGFVKEYAADCVAELCRARGVRHGLVDLGGDLSVIGPHPDGSPWLIGVRHPRQPGHAIATLPLYRGGIASSGDYERCIVFEGRRYGHILDPRTGWPVEGLLCATVVAPRCLVAGSASTIAMLKGEELGGEWLDTLGLPSLRMNRDGTLGGSAGPAKTPDMGPTETPGERRAA